MADPVIAVSVPLPYHLCDYVPVFSSTTFSLILTKFSNPIFLALYSLLSFLLFSLDSYASSSVGQLPKDIV